MEHFCLIELISSSGYHDTKLTFGEQIKPFKIARDPFYGLAKIPAWISDHIHYTVWDKIIYPFLNFTGCSVEVWEWINSFTPRFNGASDYLSMLVLKLGHVNKRNTWYLTISRGTSSITIIVAKTSHHRMLQMQLIQFYNKGFVLLTLCLGNPPPMDGFLSQRVIKRVLKCAYAWRPSH